MAESKGEGYVKRRLVCGVTEHHALVAGTLLFGFFALDTSVDVVALLMNGEKNAAGVAIEKQFGAVIAYFVDYTTCRALNVNVCLAFYLAGYNYLTGSDKGLACDFRLRVAGKKFIEYGIGNLVGHFIGVTF